MGGGGGAQMRYGGGVKGDPRRDAVEGGTWARRGGGRARSGAVERELGCGEVECEPRPPTSSPTSPRGTSRPGQNN
jgi:hypothetical protein